MKLKDCKYGVLVCTKDRSGNIERVGMVVGITNNCPSASEDVRGVIERAIPLVKWSSGLESGIHAGNIELLK